ncbi:MAG: hypothetical protein IKQ49_00115 [Eubacterium sp.]|nr:hypothetical protein [Eubacterium sp.]
MAGKGYITLYRDICDTWLYDDKPFSRSAAFVDLLMMVSHQDRELMFNGVLVKVQAGELVTSDRVLMSRWDWGKDKTRKFIRQLVESGWIEIETMYKIGTRIRINNYGGNPFERQTTPKPQKPQKSDHPKGPKSDHLSDHLAPSIDKGKQETADHLSDQQPDNRPDNKPDNRPVTINKNEEHSLTIHWEKGKESPTMKKYGLYENVPLLPDEFIKLSDRFPTLYQARIEYMSSQIKAGKVYDDIFSTLWSWCLRFEEKQKSETDSKKRLEQAKNQFLTRPTSDSLKAIEDAAIRARLANIDDEWEA